MRILVADALKELTPYRLNIVDPLPNEADRGDKLETIKAYAMDLATDFFNNMLFPSPVNINLVAMRGFDRVSRPFSDATGVINFLVRFSCHSQTVVEFEAPFPVSRGQVYTPSVIIYGGKKYILSQALIDEIVARLETIRPKLYNPYMKSQEIKHDPNMQQPMFSSPVDSSGWSDLISERYC